MLHKLQCTYNLTDMGHKSDDTNFKSVFNALSHEEQYNVIVPIIMSADGMLKWRLKSLLSYTETPDLLTLLPLEIQVLILSFIDGSSLLKACQVSKDWNQLISGCDGVWRRKAREIGVNMAAKPEDISWYTAFVTSKRQRHFMETGKGFKEKYMNLQNSVKSVKGVHYNSGYLCSVSEDDRITIWQIELNAPVLSFLVHQAVSCINFRRDSTLVCGHFTGILTSWDLSESCDGFLRSYDSHRNEPPEFPLLKAEFRTHAGPVFSCDFSDRLQLLVSGSADETVKFWCLRTGVHLYTLTSPSHWILKVVLRPFHGPGGESHSLLTMTRESVDRYQWLLGVEPPADERGDFTIIKLAASVKLNEKEDNFITPGLQVSARTVGLVKQDLEEKRATLELLDQDSLAARASIVLDFKVRKLMALGERFALLLSIGKVLFTSTLVIVDLRTGDTVGTYTVPHSKMTTPNGAQMMVGDTQWLDGLTGWKFFKWKDTDEPLDSGCPAYVQSRVVRGVLPSCRFLVLAAGLRSEEGKVYTAWWDVNEDIKTKVE